MNKIILSMLVGMVSNTAFASDQWICKDEASEKRGNTIVACGVGIASDEDTARDRAYTNARIEFDHVCQGSSDCEHHEITIEPKRMTCEETTDSQTKCYRMIQFSIGDVREAGSKPRYVQYGLFTGVQN